MHAVGGETGNNVCACVRACLRAQEWVREKDFVKSVAEKRPDQLLFSPIVTTPAKQ